MMHPNPLWQMSNKLVRKGTRLVQHSTEDMTRLLSQSFTTIPVTNKKELRIIGLRRTGNHTVAEWIKAQQPGKVEHLNNLEVRCNPYRYKYEKIIDFYPEHTQWAHKHYLPLAKGDFVDLDCLICGYEDHALPSIYDPIFENFHDIYLGKSGQRFEILILRDPFNLFASRFKSNMLDVKSTRSTAVELWIQYAKEFLDETQYLKQNKVCINYNLWVDDVDYRRNIAKTLGLEFTDSGINRVASLGGGSSFEGQQMDGKGSKMQVLDRWKHFVDDNRYREIFQNKTLLDYSQKIFGDIPGTDVLL